MSEKGEFWSSVDIESFNSFGILHRSLVVKLLPPENLHCFFNRFVVILGSLAQCSHWVKDWLINCAISVGLKGLGYSRHFNVSQCKLNGSSFTICNGGIIY